MSKIFQFVQKRLGMSASDSTLSMQAYKTNVLIWGMFMSSSMKAAIHLGPNYLANLEVYKNTNFEEIQCLFNITQKLILEHSEEILNVYTIESASPSWTRSTLAHDQMIQWTKAKVRQVEDSKCQLLTKNYRESMENPIEFDWNSTRTSLGKSRMICENGTLDLKNSQIGSSSCQCSTTSIGQEKETMEFVLRIQKIQAMCEEILAGTLDVLRSWDEEKWYGTVLYTPEGKWDSTATQMVERFQETGHPAFKSICASTRGILRKKNNRDTIHFNADASNTQLLFRIIHSVNQLSINGSLRIGVSSSACRGR